MEKPKKQLIEVETSTVKRNDALSEMQAERRPSFYVPASPSQTYQYLPMKADREIRLLYLEPGSSKSRLSCSLRVVTLSETPVYEALSYTWGKPVFPASIKCSPSGQICITENLSVALCHLRLKDRVRVLWVDAICINQQDLVERSQQVSLMRDIYEGADPVIVWLGKDDGNAKTAFERIQDFPRVDNNGFVGVRGKKRTAERDAAMENLLKRGWFLRIWVIQELVCAGKATIMCGNQSMEWERFLDLAGEFQAGSFYSVALNDPLYNLAQIRREKEQRRLGKQSSLLYLLSAFRFCQATDPRDKIFALVGIADGQSTAACTPDYSDSVSEIYRNLAFHLIIAERNPDVLTLCAAPPKGQSLSHPSWIPDWSRPQSSDPSLIVRPDAYKASAGTSFKGRIDFNTLSLDGVLLNKIVVLSRALNPNSRTGQSADRKTAGKRILKHEEESFKIFKQSRNYAQSDLTAYVRALVADIYDDEHRLNPQQLLVFCATYRWSIPTVTANWGFASSWDKISTTQIGNFDQPVGWQDVPIFATAMGTAATGRAFCLFDDGRVGWVPESAEIGDRTAIFSGGTVPILLRSSGNDYIVLGEAYVDGMMDGQAFEEPEIQVETITLV